MKITDSYFDLDDKRLEYRCVESDDVIATGDALVCCMRVWAPLVYGRAFLRTWLQRQAAVYSLTPGMVTVDPLLLPRKDRLNICMKRPLIFFQSS